MIPLTLDDVARAVDGRLAGGARGAALVTADPVIDSRLSTPGSLFVAVAGERVDGHAFAATALQRGAAAVLAGRDLDVPCVVVADTVAALARLARAVLSRLPAVDVVGVTGSSGKTTTKDLLAQVVAQLGPVVAPVGSFNNELGLPLTVLRADERTRFLVLEYSARSVGHIRTLCEIAPPRVGVELNVGSAHLGEFGSREAIGVAKAELVEALPSDGLAVLNADDDVVARMRGRTAASVVTFGRSAVADVRADDVRLDELARPRFRLLCDGEAVDVRLAVHGEHLVPNALAVAAVAARLGMPLEQIARALGEARAASRWRMEVRERPDGVVVVNDAYNANPESVRAALRALQAIGAGTRRTWAVLGEMRELGAASAAEHRGVGEAAVAAGVGRVVAVGNEAAGVVEGVRSAAGAGDVAGRSTSAVEVEDAAAALGLLRAEVQPGDVVLVKASRAVGLEHVAEGLLADGAAGRQVPA